MPLAASARIDFTAVARRLIRLHHHPPRAEWALRFVGVLLGALLQHVQVAQAAMEAALEPVLVAAEALDRLLAVAAGVHQHGQRVAGAQ
jgi:hypothetical protein